MPNTYNPGLQVIDGADINQLANQEFGFQNGITALSGGGYAGAPLIKAGSVEVTTVAADNDSIALPAAQPNPGTGISATLVRNSGAHTLAITPQGTDQVNKGGLGTAFALVAGKSALLFCPSKNNWFAIVSA